MVKCYAECSAVHFNDTGRVMSRCITTTRQGSTCLLQCRKMTHIVCKSRFLPRRKMLHLSYSVWVQTPAAPRMVTVSANTSKHTSEGGIIACLDKSKVKCAEAVELLSDSLPTCYQLLFSQDFFFNEDREIPNSFPIFLRLWFLKTCWIDFAVLSFAFWECNG